MLTTNGLAASEEPYRPKSVLLPLRMVGVAQTVVVEFDPNLPTPTAEADPAAFALPGWPTSTRFVLDATPPEDRTITAWRLDVISSTSGVQITATGGASLPEVVVWDGRDEGGQIVPGGAYSYTLVVPLLR